MELQDLREDWFVRVVHEGVDAAGPGIYEWRIEGVGVYIGRARKLRRRAREYLANVRLMLNGRPYRIPGRDFRRVHKGLFRGHQEDRRVTLTFLENCPRDLRNEREAHWIWVRHQEALEGGLPVLNAD